MTIALRRQIRSLYGHFNQTYVLLVLAESSLPSVFSFEGIFWHSRLPLSMSLVNFAKTIKKADARKFSLSVDRGRKYLKS